MVTPKYVAIVTQGEEETIYLTMYNNDVVVLEREVALLMNLMRLDSKFTASIYESAPFVTAIEARSNIQSNQIVL